MGGIESITDTMMSVVGSGITAIAKRLGPMITAIFQSIFNVLISYLVYFVKLLIVPLARYGGAIMFIVGLMLWLCFLIISRKWIDNSIEEAYKEQYKNKENKENNNITYKITFKEYTEYKEYKFKLLVPTYTTFAVMVIGAALFGLSFVADKYIEKEAPNASDLNENIQPLINSLKEL